MSYRFLFNPNKGSLQGFYDSVKLVLPTPTTLKVNVEPVTDIRTGVVTPIPLVNPSTAVIDPVVVTIPEILAVQTPVIDLPLRFKLPPNSGEVSSTTFWSADVKYVEESILPSAFKN